LNSIQYKILFASSEVFPLIKTGGLADVAQALPCALHELNQDVRIIMPAYRDLNKLVKKTKLIASQVFLEGDVKLYETTLPESDVVIWLVDCPALYDREGGPYLDENDEPWEDNAQRFALFSRVIAAIAANNMQLQWCPDILHCNDWQTALAPALLQYEKSKPGIVFTIHNLAYQGVFPLSVQSQLQLPAELASFESMEFYGKFSFIKGGILYADQVTTVSPTYAQEIQTKEYGAGLDELLKINSHKLSGIINGINEDEWNPSKDKHLYEHYNLKSLEEKAKNKTALQKDLNLICDEKIPLLATISRLVTQKGIDLIIEILPRLAKLNLQIVILGKGEPELEEKLSDLVYSNLGRFSIRVGYDEALAHKITAAADFFMMPSRFEPCGLNQMYSQRYGTIPIVRNTGGLADTVIGEQGSGVENNSTGIIFEKDNADDLLAAILRGLEYYKDKKIWKQMQLNAMQQDFSWKNSAQQYMRLYSKILS
jgi:starch synthase